MTTFSLINGFPPPSHNLPLDPSTGDEALDGREPATPGTGREADGRLSGACSLAQNQGPPDRLPTGRPPGTLGQGLAAGDVFGHATLGAPCFFFLLLHFYLDPFFHSQSNRSPASGWGQEGRGYTPTKSHHPCDRTFADSPNGPRATCPSARDVARLGAPFEPSPHYWAGPGVRVCFLFVTKHSSTRLSISETPKEFQFHECHGFTVIYCNSHYFFVLFHEKNLYRPPA